MKIQPWNVSNKLLEGWGMCVCGGGGEGAGDT